MADSEAQYFRKIPYKQDMPPKGGYSKIPYHSKVTRRGPSGAWLFAGCAGVMTFGWICVWRGKRLEDATRREIDISRIIQVPFLQAEQDRYVLKALKDNLEKEKILMADVEGWQPGVHSSYNTDRWVPPRQKELIPL